MAAKGMIFLEAGHPVIHQALEAKLASGAKAEPVDLRVADFDDVQYQLLVTKDEINMVKLSVSMSCLPALLTCGAEDCLASTYAGYKTDTMEGFDLTLQIDTSGDVADAAAIATKFSQIKRNLVGAPFSKAFKGLCDGTPVPAVSIPYRPQESLWIVPSSDRVVVVYGICFSDDTDREIAEVFLQEFSEAQRHVSNAPPVNFTKEPPREIEGLLKGQDESADLIGFVSFAVFRTHVDSDAKCDKVVTLLQGFRNYLHYHIKASKAYLHTRMRRRVDSLLKVLNRAKPTDENKQKRTATGRTFTRK